MSGFVGLPKLSVYTLNILLLHFKVSAFSISCCHWLKNGKEGRNWYWYWKWLLQQIIWKRAEEKTYSCGGIRVTSVQCVPVQAQYGSLAKTHSPQLLWKLQFATGSCTIPECDDTNNKPCLLRERVQSKRVKLMFCEAERQVKCVNVCSNTLTFKSLGSIQYFSKKDALKWSKLTFKMSQKIYIFQMNAVIFNCLFMEKLMKKTKQHNCSKVTFYAHFHKL